MLKSADTWNRVLIMENDLGLDKTTDRQNMDRRKSLSAIDIGCGGNETEWKVEHYKEL